MPAEKPLRVFIVDDEAPARALVREYLEAHAGVEIAAECANGFEAIKAANEQAPDVIFLDVQMPKLDGFEVLELLERPCAVVFVTAYDEYALRAFEANAVDYLLKPVSRERFDAALARARERAGTGAAAPPPAGALAREARPAQMLERLLIRQEARVHVIPVEAVDYIEAQDDYVAIHAEGRSHLKNTRLAELEAGLDPRRFVRIHRSYLLNVDRLVRLELVAKDNRVAILRDGRTLPVSRSGYAKLKELL
jgi:two-component system LytT family response regulator